MSYFPFCTLEWIWSQVDPLPAPQSGRSFGPGQTADSEPFTIWMASIGMELSCWDS